MMQTKKRSECPISCSLDIWGDKWSLLIIRDLMLTKKCAYGDFLKSPEKIATNILVSRLELLETNNIIEKINNLNNNRASYVLTKKGIELLPVLIEIQLWADKYLPISDEWKDIIEEIKLDKEGFIKKAYEGFGI